MPTTDAIADEQVAAPALERSDEALLNLVKDAAGQTPLTDREWARLAVLAADQAGMSAGDSRTLRVDLGLSCCDGSTRHRVWCKNYWD